LSGTATKPTFIGGVRGETVWINPSTPNASTGGVLFVYGSYITFKRLVFDGINLSGNSNVVLIGSDDGPAGA
jgi:hypothetical protein